MGTSILSRAAIALMLVLSLGMTTASFAYADTGTTTHQQSNYVNDRSHSNDSNWNHNGNQNSNTWNNNWNNGHDNDHQNDNHNWYQYRWLNNRWQYVFDWTGYCWSLVAANGFQNLPLTCYAYVFSTNR